ncbi:MAG TPA: carbohydrate ABC transporter permease [Clostridiales bacterium]|nr:carbohydrate ABC transporter permease [Clostridiales bacterium]
MDLQINKKTSFDYFNILFLFMYGIICIFPFYYVFIVSISDFSQVTNNIVFIWPKGVNLGIYKNIMRYKGFTDGLKVSVFRTVVGTALGLSLQTMLAYALSKKCLPGRRFMVLYIIFTLIFNGGMIPTYIVIRNLGLVDKIWVLIIPGLISSWNVILLMSFFSSIPVEIEESARIDGANDILILIKLILPLSLPSLATIGLFIAVGHWNALMDGVIYINREELKPLQAFLVNLVSSQNSSMGMNHISFSEEQRLPPYTTRCAIIFASTVPILVVYPFVQKYFIKGLMIGAIKG